MMTIQHKFVEFIPETLEDELLYISLEYCVAVHKCVCGCGNKVVTPLSPTDWELRFNGKTVSLEPSIGNWAFECKSHYWIKKGEVYHARKWEDWEIKAGRNADAKNKRLFFKKKRKRKK